MENAFIITFIGDDRPGLVEQLSATVESCGGNWHESRLSQLGGKFTGLILVSLPDQEGAKLEEALKGLASSGLSVRVTPTAAGSTPAESGMRRIQLRVLGPDRTGIVREISAALAAQQVNVIEMDSAVESAPMSAELLFRSTIDAQVPAEADLDALQDKLDDIANQMTLDIDLD